MVTIDERIRHQRSWPWWRWILTGLNILGLVFSSVLSWNFLEGGSIIGCIGGSPCDQVLNSQWSVIAGLLPVSGMAVGVYLAVFVAGFFIGPATEIPIRHLAWSAMLILVGSIAGSAIWFTILQKWVIGNYCLYCTITHINGMLLAVLVIWRSIMEYDEQSKNNSLMNPSTVESVFPASQRIIRPMRAMGLVIIGLVLAGILVVSQVVLYHPADYGDGVSQADLPAIDYHTVPMVGSPDAPYVVTLLFDYQCRHCQKIHFMLDEAISRFDNKLAFALCPAPLNTQCNPYIPRDVDEFKNSCELVKIGLAVWVSKREAFPIFENWMYSFESGNIWHPRSLESARTKAVELVGQAMFDAAWSNPWTVKYLKTCIRIYGQTIQSGKEGVPKLIFGSRWVIPELNNADDLVLILQKSLAVPNP